MFIYKWPRMLTANKKVSNLWHDLFKFDAVLYQAFLSFSVNI